MRLGDIRISLPHQVHDMLDRLISELKVNNVHLHVAAPNHKFVQGEQYVKRSYDDSTPNLSEYYALFSAKSGAQCEPHLPTVTLDSSMRCHVNCDANTSMYFVAKDGYLIKSPNKLLSWSRAELEKYRMLQPQLQPATLP